MTGMTRLGWLRTLAVLTVVVALMSSADHADSAAVCLNDTDCGCSGNSLNGTNCSGPGEGGRCIQGSCLCNPGYALPFCAPLGACCGVSTCAQGGPGHASLCVGSGAPCSDLTEAECQSANGTFAGNGTSCATGGCDDTPTPTATPTSTPTRIPQGGECTDASECATDFCEQGFCCNTACDGPLVSCNQPGQQGICAAIVAPAPAASHTGLLAMVAALGLVGLVAMSLRRRA